MVFEGCNGPQLKHAGRWRRSRWTEAASSSVDPDRHVGAKKNGPQAIGKCRRRDGWHHQDSRLVDGRCSDGNDGAMPPTIRSSFYEAAGSAQARHVTGFRRRVRPHVSRHGPRLRAPVITRSWRSRTRRCDLEVHDVWLPCRSATRVENAFFRVRPGAIQSAQRAFERQSAAGRGTRRIVLALCNILNQMTLPWLQANVVPHRSVKELRSRDRCALVPIHATTPHRCSTAPISTRTTARRALINRPEA